MECALIVSGSEKAAALVSEMLSRASIQTIAVAHTAGEAKRFLIECDVDLCVVNGPLPDEPAEVLARSIAQAGSSEVILLVKAEIHEDVAARVEDDGVVTVAKPVSRTMLWNAIKLTQAAHRKLSRMRSENTKLLQKIEDIRIVDRAKLVLISVLSMTEPEAHKYIERQAMDLRATKRAVAEGILRRYEDRSDV